MTCLYLTAVAFHCKSEVGIPALLFPTSNLKVLLLTSSMKPTKNTICHCHFTFIQLIRAR